MTEKDEFAELREEMERCAKIQERQLALRECLTRDLIAEKYSDAPKQQKGQFFEQISDFIDYSLEKTPSNLGLIFLNKLLERLNRDEFNCYVSRLVGLDTYGVLQHDDIIHVLEDGDETFCNTICKLIKSDLGTQKPAIADRPLRAARKFIDKTNLKFGLAAGAVGLANKFSGHNLVPDEVWKVSGMSAMGVALVNMVLPETMDCIPLKSIGDAVNAHMKSLECEARAR